MATQRINIRKQMHRGTSAYGDYIVFNRYVVHMLMHILYINYVLNILKLLAATHSTHQLIYQLIVYYYAKKYYFIMYNSHFCSLLCNIITARKA